MWHTSSVVFFVLAGFIFGLGCGFDLAKRYYGVPLKEHPHHEQQD